MSTELDQHLQKQMTEHFAHTHGVWPLHKASDQSHSSKYTILKCDKYTINNKEECHTIMHTEEAQDFLKYTEH